MHEDNPRDPAWKIALFRQRFCVGLDHVYGRYDPVTGNSWQIKGNITDAVILDHLVGRKPLGVYFLTGTRTRAAVVDFDVTDANPPLAFADACGGYGLNAYMERSKVKGHHAWLFFPETGVPADKVRAVLNHILDEVGCAGVEVFPKQDRIDLVMGQYGNFVNVPLFGALVRRGRTVFLDPDKGLKPYADQWDALVRIKTVAEATIDTILEANEIPVPSNKPRAAGGRALGVWEAMRSLPPCVRRMLEDGVPDFQRLTCFRLAVHLRRVGLPLDVTTGALLAWREKNRPTQGKRRITAGEVRAQAVSAYKADYQGNACDQPEVERYCSSSCPIYPAVASQRRLGINASNTPLQTDGLP